MKKTSMMVGSLMLATLGTAGAANAANAANGEAAQSDTLAVHDLGAVAMTGEGTETSPLTSTATTSYIRTAVPIGCNHNGTLLRASGAKAKHARKPARRARSASA